MKIAVVSLAAALVCLSAPAAFAKSAHSYGAVAQQDQVAARHLYSSGNECGPDRATPVWGVNNELLGYACEPASANGN